MSSPVVLIRSAMLLVVGTAAIALAACGESTVDQDALESGVMTVGERTADLDSVSCPDDVSQDEGTEFECTVVNDAGEEVPVTGTITGIDGDDVLFEIQTVDGVDITK